jgi:hypothetical protein
MPRRRLRALFAARKPVPTRSSCGSSDRRAHPYASVDHQAAALERGHGVEVDLRHLGQVSPSLENWWRRSIRPAASAGGARGSRGRAVRPGRVGLELQRRADWLPPSHRHARCLVRRNPMPASGRHCSYAFATRVARLAPHGLQVRRSFGLSSHPTHAPPPNSSPLRGERHRPRAKWVEDRAGKSGPRSG